MSGELKRAAERLRQHIDYGCTSIEPHMDCPYNSDVDADEESDRELLASAYLAEHPANDGEPDWKSIALALCNKATWFLSHKADEFKSCPELNQITQANGCEGWISTLAMNWHNELASSMSSIMSTPDDDEPVTGQALAGIGGVASATPNRNGHVVYRFDIPSRGARKFLWISENQGHVDIHGMSIAKVCENMGDVRRLLKALGAM